MTLGVRAVVTDGTKVFLVRHSYVAGWHLPGGAVDRGESAEAAVIRELREEGGLQCDGRPLLVGFYRNAAYSPRDHVACYVVRQYRQIEDRKPDWEIAESGFFPIDALPDDTTRATRARLIEILDNVAASEDW